MNVMDQATQVAEEKTRKLDCATCRWDQNCIKPPDSKWLEDKAKFDEAKKKPPEDRDAMMGVLLDFVVLAGRDTACPACPVLIARLSESPYLAAKVKEIMREWREE